jgi:hypothetical protein
MDITDERRDEIRQVIFSGFGRTETMNMARAADCTQSVILFEIARMKEEGLLG